MMELPRRYSTPLEGGPVRTQRFHVTEPWCLPLFYSNFRKRSFGRSSSALRLCPGCVESFKVDVCSVKRCLCAEDACYRTLVSRLVQGLGPSPSAPQAATCPSG